MDLQWRARHDREYVPIGSFVVHSLPRNQHVAGELKDDAHFQVAGQTSRALAVATPGNVVIKRRVLPTAAAGVAAAAWADAPVIRSVVSMSEGMKRAACR